MAGADRDAAQCDAGFHNYVWGETPTLADLSAELRAAWSADTLYFAARIPDDVLVGNKI